MVPLIQLKLYLAGNISPKLDSKLNAIKYNQKKGDSNTLSETIIYLEKWFGQFLTDFYVPRNPGDML